MNRGVSETRPWYRHRWPWFLMAGPAAVVAAGIVTAWIAMRSSDGLVADDYYKQGLEVNRKLARDEAAAAMQIEARLRLADGRIDIRLASRAGAALPARLRVKLTHPVRAREDRELVLSGDTGAYTGVLAPIGAGRWQVAIEDEAGTWRVAGLIHLPDEPEVLLMAGGKR